MTFTFDSSDNRTANAIFNAMEREFEAMEREFEAMEFGPTVIESDPWVALDPVHHFSGLVHPSDPVGTLLDSDEARTELVVSHHMPR